MIFYENDNLITFECTNDELKQFQQENDRDQMIVDQEYRLTLIELGVNK